MTDLDRWYAFRSRMVDVLAADLMGGTQDTEIRERPLDRFVLGILHPQDGSSMDESDTEVDSADTAGAPMDAVFDPAVALSRMRYPSSVGLTFAVDVNMTDDVVVDVAAARYAPPDSQDEGATDGHAECWRRQATIASDVRVPTRAVGSRTIRVDDGLELYVVVRQPVDGVSSMTIVLVNTFTRDGRGLKDPKCWFQPELSVRTAQGLFVPRRTRHLEGVEDDDLDAYELLFRNVQNLAVGHGCAVAWDETGSGVDRLEVTFMPRYDVKVAEPAGGAGMILPMAELGRADNWSSLMSLVTDYRQWISRQERRVDDLDEPLQDTARRHLADAHEAADRMERGVRILETDPGAASAFQLMNQAMELQRSRQDIQRGQADRVQTWRPFQMAFILLNLEGLTDVGSPERNLADLLWFPTGGGKTEAYLGLIGYAILLRRIRDPHDGGVSVIMRYTLRLLTIQQFERASGLVCALETLRERHLPDASPISLGLWVGQAAAPNNVKDAKAALTALRQGQPSPKGNPRQLLHCPVCGGGLTLDDYRILANPDRMQVRCHNRDCEYSKGLPVHLLDEDVYRERPSLLIGTVDKFAMMAWRSEVRNLFSRDGKNSPPDLIVQDELHLISGPLGTMVGLYETAVDAATTGESRAKIVASTATIRRATQQVRVVFDRESRQFPPPGLDSTDSYFSVEAAPEEKGTRRYLGLLAPAVSHTTLMVRCYAALLQAVKDLPEDDVVKDAYWTLLGYFNSLRVLGGAYMQVWDDVPDRLKVVAGRAGAEPRIAENVGELTSRVESKDIPAALASLGVGLPDPETQDVVLATNMISVGLDVDRLGLMAVMGQPQTTAEYIQSTSRVGRQYPGLVVVLYNAARSRDLSHYETFGAYHRTLYRQVEATGATPFAARARDRGLHGVLVSAVRLLVDDLAADEHAVQLPRFMTEVDGVVDMIVKRAQRVSPTEAEKVRRQLDSLVSNWRDACSVPALKYAGWRQAAGALLQEAGRVLQGETAGFPVEEPAWPTMTSLRDVDVSSSLYLVPATAQGRN